MNTIPMSQHHIRESAALIVLRVMFTFFLYEVLSLLFFVIFFNYNPFDSIGGTLFVLTTVHFVLTFLLGFILLSFVLSRLAIDYYITEHALVIHTGILQVEEQIYDLQHMKDVRRNQGIWAKIFKYGNLKITIATGSYQKEIVLRGIRKPKKYQSILEQIITSQGTPKQVSNS